jgi:hypothetical protein
MKTVLVLAGALLLLFARGAMAQPPPPGQKLGLAANFQREYAAIKRDLMEAAQKMPEPDFGFKPSPMSDVRTTVSSSATLPTCSSTTAPR